MLDRDNHGRFICKQERKPVPDFGKLDVPLWGHLPLPGTAAC